VPFKYKYKGDVPRSLPEFAIERVAPGETVETVQPIDHPDFEPRKLTKADKAEAEAVEAAVVDQSEPPPAAVDQAPEAPASS
jgi:hypothetical protein